MAKIKRALISVSDKTGLTDIVKELANHNIDILSTGGTAKTIRESGIKVTDVSEYTGFPEMMDGRIKTSHPKIHGALLGKRSVSEHLDMMKKHNIIPIDMVIVNLYPFEATVAKPDCDLNDAIENIDIGGPAMLRSSAKNYEDVTVIIDNSDYNHIIREMRENNGCISIKTNFYLAKKVFSRTSAYDAAISNYLSNVDMDDPS